MFNFKYYLRIFNFHEITVFGFQIDINKPVSKLLTDETFVGRRMFVTKLPLLVLVDDEELVPSNGVVEN